jgi:hypothetical protein
LGYAQVIIRGARACATSIVVRIFARNRVEGPAAEQDDGRFYKLREYLVVPLICPTCQNVFAGPCIRAGDRQATLHGVVFDILVGSDHSAGLAAAKAWLAEP